MPGAVSERPAVVVEGLRGMQAALAKTDRDVRLGVRRGLREVAEPVRHDVETLAVANIRRIRFSPLWVKMRVGVTRTLVYVAPRQRGVKGRGYDPRRRGYGYAHPPFNELMLSRAMEPALKRHEAQLMHAFEDLLDHIADDFNHPSGAAL